MPVSELARDWLALYLAPGLGNRRLQQLQQRFPDPAEAIAFLKGGQPKAAQSKAALNVPDTARRWLKSPDQTLIDQHLEWAEHPAHHILILGNDDYPELLADTTGAPLLLFVVGNPDYLWQPQIAVVGSRNPSHNGLQLATEMTEQLAKAGMTITSGLAGGIDAAAHTAALSQQQPTIAVLGTGVDRVYPAANKPLAQRIAAHGALVSEFALGTEPRAGHFPARNRIISGLSVATLVIEAGLRSGSLITARLAAEQGREVMAVPGSVRNATSRGCHALIRDGARLVENANQLLEDIAPLAGRLATRLTTMARNNDASSAIEADSNHHNNETQQPTIDELPNGLDDQAWDDDYRRLLQALGGDPLNLDELVEATDLTPEAISSMLLMLELRGHVAAEPGGNWTRIHEVG